MRICYSNIAFKKLLSVHTPQLMYRSLSAEKQQHLEWGTICEHFGWEDGYGQISLVTKIRGSLSDSRKLWYVSYSVPDCLL